MLMLTIYKKEVGRLSEKQRMIQEYVPGKQITLAHIIANPNPEIYEKLGLHTIAYATGGPINSHNTKKTRNFVYLQRFSLELS